MKAVILTCSTGQGHNSAGAAIAKKLESCAVETETKNALSFLGEKASSAITDAFVNIAVKTPHTFGVMYSLGEKISDILSDRLKSPVYLANTLYAENLGKYLSENEIDIAVCPHLFPAEALTYLKRKNLIKTKCFFISTDYTCIPFLDETEMDKIFIPDISMKNEFTEKGIDEKKLVFSGIPVRDIFLTKTPQNAARADLSLPESIPVFLIMTGGEGCGNAAELTKAIIEKSEGRDFRVIVLTGRNLKLFGELTETFKTNEKVLVKTFTEKVPLYMDACNVLLTKPGGISSTEAAVKKVPFIHTSPIPGCETVNAGFFSQRGMSILTSSEAQSAENAWRLAFDIPQQKRILEAQSEYINPFAADMICKEIIENN